MTQTCRIVIDQTLERSGGALDQSNWVSRRLYWSETGAKNWLAVVNEATYPLRDPNKFNLRDNYLAALSNHRFRTLVSLGPGDSRLDLELLHALHRSPAATGTGQLMYIPVDISRRLLEEAIVHVQGEAAIPVGICCDFEDGVGFLANILKVHAQRPVVFALLGGTLGNLDNGEERFFEGMRAQLQHGDAFLLDLPLAGPAWTVAEEPRLKAEAYTPVFHRFLVEGAFANRAGTEPTREAELRDSFAEWASFTHEQDAITRAEVIIISDQRTGRRLLMFRRYHWEPMLRWLEGRGFVIEFARSSIVSEQDRFGMGVALLTTRTTETRSRSIRRKLSKE